MGKRRSMMRKKKYDEAYINSIRPWLDLTDDVLSLVIMKLEVVDFIAFSRVCKSWRSHAVTNWNKFIVSKPPMSICISKNGNKKECYLKDFEGRKLKINFPHSAKRWCIGVTCGYFVLFGEKTSDFWLVNPITRHELHFPNIPDGLFCCPANDRAILVFSPTISEYVFVVFNRCYNYNIWFSIAGTREWTELSTKVSTHDLITFKGKIYTIHYVYPSHEVSLCEMKLYPEPDLVLLETVRFPESDFRCPGFVTCGENLYVIDTNSQHPFNIHEIDLDKMKWVSSKKAQREYAFFLNDYKECGVYLQYGRYVVADKNGMGRSYYGRMWYFFFDCLNVDLLHE